MPRAGKSPMVMRVALEMLRGWGDKLRAAVVLARAQGELPPGLRYAAEQGPAEAFAEVLQRSLTAGESAGVLELLYRIDSPVVRPGLRRRCGRCRCCRAAFARCDTSSRWPSAAGTPRSTGCWRSASS